ncbi:carotenoid ester lipase precursor [Lactifluus volemus]|nr:carotenoid ester lipase precursor [Lactifluus volemus]
MKITPFILASFAGQAFFSLAISFKPFVVQDQTTSVAGTGFCDDADEVPRAYLDNGTFVGYCHHRSNTARFLGIPYAKPPTSDLRLRLPQPIEHYEGNYPADKFGSSCPQQRLDLPPDLDSPLNSLSTTLEDCLTINVITPENATPTSQLPVVVWIFGGGFEIGGTAIYDGGVLVGRSVEIGQPIVFVSMNYRVSALGFLPGKEVKEAKIGNLGLQDQRLALKWVQKHVSAFGGDPSKVTIWGESAGAISVALHMLVNNGNQEGLFRGAIMQSGGPVPVGDIEHGQPQYDALVKKAGCDGSSDTLDCLRKVPYSKFKYAMDNSPNFFAYQGLALTWLPRVDGVFLTEPPQYAVVRGHVADVPMITGMGFSTTDEVNEFLRSFMMPTASKNEVDSLLQNYPDDHSAGCPFDTGDSNVLGRYKRIAAIQGDIVFHGPRRLLLKYQASKQRSWAFLHKRFKWLPFIGAAHGTDILNPFNPDPLGYRELADYFICFTRNLDPNCVPMEPISWPQYNLKNPKLLVFQDDEFVPVKPENDDYRVHPLEFVANLSLKHPI